LNRFALAIAGVLLAGGAGSSRVNAESMIDNFSFLGPRAGISIVPEGLRETKSTAAVNSLFGWVMDVRYASRRNFEGYAEAGFFVEGVERGVLYPETWGYFGLRQKSGFGIGLGPSLSVYGLGLGIAPSYSFRMDRIMIPLTFNTVITKGEPRYQVHVGFSFASD
jgi:hypothetical protein